MARVRRRDWQRQTNPARVPFSPRSPLQDGPKRARRACFGTTRSAQGSKLFASSFQISNVTFCIRHRNRCITRGPFSNPESSESGINVLVAGLGPKDAKEYCEIEMLNEKLENARVAAGAAVNALKGIYNSESPKLICAIIKVII